MCGGKGPVYPAPAPRLVELPIRRPATSSSHRPPSSSRRSKVPQGPASSRLERPATSRPAIVRVRPLSRRPVAGESLAISQRERFANSPLSSILEHSEDRTIIRHVTNLATRIEQHVRYYYAADSPSKVNQRTPELDNPQTRHAVICRYIAKEIIGYINAVDDNNAQGLSIVMKKISAYLEPSLPIDDWEYEPQIRELCRIGDELRECIESHPADWKFGSWDEAGFITKVPALWKDGEQIVPAKKTQNGLES